MADNDILENTVLQLQAIADQEAEAMEETGEEEGQLPEAVQRIIDWSDSKENITPHLDDETKQKIIQQVENQYQDDYASMSDWRKKTKTAMELATMEKSAQKKTTPFDGASQVMAPYIMEAAIDFSSRLLMEVMSRKEPARYELWGNKKADEYPETDRCADYMNYKLVRDMNWEEETDRESLVLAIVGTTYKKVRYCPDQEEYEAVYTKPTDVVFNQDCSRFEKALQVTHDNLSFTKNEIVGSVNAGIWEYNLDNLDSAEDEDKTDWEGKEYHFWYDLDGDGFCEPYIATIMDEEGEDGNALVSLIAAFDEDDIVLEGDKITSISCQAVFAQKQFIPDPLGSPMGVGWGILFSDIFKTINTNLRQLIDAGTLQNNASNSGFISSSLSAAMGPSRQREGAMKVKMGHYQKVQSSGANSLRDSIVQLPVAGPSGTLFELLVHLEEACRRTTSAAYNVEANQNEAASLYLARLQQSLKTPTAIMIRVFRGLGKEFDILANLFYRYGDDEDYYRVVGTPEENAQMVDGPDGQQVPQVVPYTIQSDFDPDSCKMSPTVDLSHGSDVERIAKANVMLDVAKDPALQQQIGLNTREVFKIYLRTTGETEDTINALLPPPPTGPSPQEQAVMQQQQMMMEFANRELMLKEQRLALDAQETALKAQKEATELRTEAEKTRSEIDLNRASTAEKLAKIAQGDFEAQLKLLDQLARQQEKKADANNQTGGSRLAATSSNSGRS